MDAGAEKRRARGVTSPFWKYFAGLRFGPLDAPGPLQALVKGMAHRLDTVRDDAVFLRAQWFPQLCEPEMLPAHGTSRGIIRHHTETPEQFRRRVINAYAWHMLGGKQEGLPELLEFYGYSVAEIDNVRKYQPSRWAEFQVGLDTPENLAAGDTVKSLETLVWLINEYKPARSVLARMYTDIYNITPLIWSDGRWSEHYYSYFSGVPASDLGPEFGRYPGLILSFGLRHSVEVAPPGGDFGQPVFAGAQRQGFVAPYIDAAVWSYFRWGDGFPHKHGFSIAELYSTDWCERITRSYPWTGAWDDRKWAEYTVWDRPLSKWTMRNRDIPRSLLVYGDPYLSPSAGGAAPAGRWGGLNACWSAPTYIRVGRPIRWGAYHWSAGTLRERITVTEQRRERHGMPVAPTAYPPAVPAAIRCVCAIASPAHEDAWAGSWDSRPWSRYVAYFSVKSEESFKSEESL
jgi:P2-related tail formation protein